MDYLKQAPTEEARGNILVIDDSPEILGIVNELLKKDYHIKAANCGEKGLLLANAEPKPDLILLDVMMPDIDGYEVCKRLKANRLTRNIPIIFLSAMNDDSDLEKGFALGAVDYVTKPVHGVVLLARVKAHYNLKLVADFAKDKNTFLVTKSIPTVG